MRLLVLGGSAFLGRHVVEAAIERGWEVTALSRGLNGMPPAGAEHVRADRADLGPLAGRSFDAVVDTSGRDAAHVRASAALDAAHYVFVSSVSVHPAWPYEPVDDLSAVHDDGPGYGQQKAASERALAAVRPGRFASVRAGLVAGPHDHVLRLPWWLERIARGGRVLAPGPPERPLQLVDARDLARFCLDLAERRDAVTCAATAPMGQTTMRGLLELAIEVTAADAELVWVDDERLLGAGVEPWDELPLWAPWAGTWRVDASRAHALGLRHRPVRETVADTWTWLRAGGRAALTGWSAEARPRGLSPERERVLLG